MKSKKLIFATVFVLLGMQINFAQNAGDSTAPGVSSKLLETLSKNMPQITSKTPVSREKREQSYTQLLEGQQSLWALKTRQMPEAARINALRISRQAFQKAIELNPLLAEGYTALAEVSVPEEATVLANIAIKIDKNNYGAHLLLAHNYTATSRLNTGVLDPEQTQKAIAEWKEVVRLDPRNAEANAFLSEFYARTNKTQEQIAALRSWVSSVPPILRDSYSRLFRGENLSSENASVKLGEVLAKNNQKREAIEILSMTVADNPENDRAIKLLSDTVETADNDSVSVAVQPLQQAVYANPDNPLLSDILGLVYYKLGKLNEAEKSFQDALKIDDTATKTQERLGDVYQKQGKTDLAKQTWQKALASAMDTTDVERLKAKITGAK